MDGTQQSWLGAALDELGASQVERLARLALADEAVDIVDWTLDRLPSTGGGQFQTAVYRLRGRAANRSIDGSTESFTSIVKIVNGGTHEAPSAFRSVRREHNFYTRADSVVALPRGLRQPRCYDTIDRGSLSILFLEDVGSDRCSHRGVGFYEELARSLGQFNGSVVDESSLPAWCSQDVLATEVEELDRRLGGRPLAALTALGRGPQAKTLSDCLKTTHERRHDLLAGLARCRRGIAHQEAFSRNVAPVNGGIALFDWATVGLAPVGTDAAGLFWLTLGYLDVDAAGAAGFEQCVFEAYRSGLDDAGFVVDPAELRFVFTATSALRHLTMLANAAPLAAAGDPVVAALVGRPVAQVVESWMATAPMIGGLLAEALHHLDHR